MGFVTRVRGLDGVVYSNGVTVRDTTTMLRRALALARARHAPRVWIVRTHLYRDERASWRTTFRELGHRPQSIRVGVETVWVIKP
jgi:hypothetical protein